MADVKELSTSFDLNRAFSPEAQDRYTVLRARIEQVWGHSILSPDTIGIMLKQLRSLKRQDDGDLTHAVKAIPHLNRVIRPSRPDEPTRIEYLRDGRFLTIDIDLTAALKDDLLKEIGEYIDLFQSKQVEGPRPRKHKHHTSTSDIDMWDVYDQWKHGRKPYQIARQVYRKRTGNVADFGSHTKEYKAVQGKLKAAQGKINSFRYPPQLHASLFFLVASRKGFRDE
jgi:hypothetical protein